jgi:dehydrogenase/reductase SDR family member 7B
MGTLKGKHIWITGASSGIGKALSHELVQQGALVLISARKVDDLEKVKITAADPAKIQILPLDLTLMDSHAGKVEEALRMMGHIDIMVHNGGISQRSLVKDTPLSVDRKVMEVDYFGTVSLTKALLPHFIEHKSGHFTVVTSLMGVFSSPMRSGYCGAKHALHGFFDALRAEHHKDHIAVTIVCPGFIHTDISRHSLTASGNMQGTMDEATGAGMSPEECAAKMAKAMRKQKAEVYIGRKEILAIYLKRYFPGILRRIVRKVKVT